MHIVVTLVLLVIAIVWWLAFKHFNRTKGIGKAQEETKDLKAQKELKELNESNDELASKINGEDNE